MEIAELIRALANFDTLSARQWVADAGRERIEWSRVAAPPIDDPLEMAIAASMVEPSPSTRLEQALRSAHHELEKLLLEQGVRDENLVGQFQEGIKA